MKLLGFLKDCLFSLPILTFGNILLIWQIRAGDWMLFKGFLTAFLGFWYLASIFRFYPKHAGSHRLAMISHGLRLFRYMAICSVYEFIISIGLIAAWNRDGRFFVGWTVGNFLFFAGCMLFMAFWGIVKLGIAARQVKWYWYLFLYLVWWITPMNLIPLIYIYRTALRELHFETARMELDAVHKENEACKTKYPILMVHGIFFRDWQFFNYWGRIPAALQRYGAQVYYGKQQSSQCIAKSAQELKEQIEAVLAETGAEKVNIIAHSKGGLDTRYAIAELGIAPYVASLTMINTPHNGCAWVDHLLEKLPNKLVDGVAKHYNHIFHVLGDESPDFLAGVNELTAKSCKVFNEKYPIDLNIPHHCIMSEMRAVYSAPFPMWLGYLCNKYYDKESCCDGLVPVESAKLEGVPFTLIPKTVRRGISHGDMIDLNRENIEGFDVREFYVGIVKDLKEKGL
ncbi:MAG: triacylglycerol lipase [Ruminococcus sp.]|nr:triacylglycerol lipase [Ruminococcus sp.]